MCPRHSKLASGLQHIVDVFRGAWTEVEEMRLERDLGSCLRDQGMVAPIGFCPLRFLVKPRSIRCMLVVSWTEIVLTDEEPALGVLIPVSWQSMRQAIKNWKETDHSAVHPGGSC